MKRCAEAKKASDEMWLCLKLLFHWLRLGWLISAQVDVQHVTMAAADLAIKTQNVTKIT